MNLRQSKANGKYDRNFSNWFLNGKNSFIRTHITQDKLKNFYSLRHSFINELKQRLVDGNIISEIAGHSDESQTLGRYGKSFALKTKLEGMLTMDYGVDISELKRIATC